MVNLISMLEWLLRHYHPWFSKCHLCINNALEENIKTNLSYSKGVFIMQRTAIWKPNGLSIMSLIAFITWTTIAGVENQIWEPVSKEGCIHKVVTKFRCSSYGRTGSSVKSGIQSAFRCLVNRPWDYIVSWETEGRYRHRLCTVCHPKKIYSWHFGICYERSGTAIWKSILNYETTTLSLSVSESLECSFSNNLTCQWNCSLYIMSLPSVKAWKEGTYDIPCKNPSFFMTTEPNRMGVCRGADYVIR